MSYILKDRRILITGASSGIGEATAHAVAAKGALPVLVARRHSELERVAYDLRKRWNVEAITIPGDLTNSADRAHIAEVAARIPGGVHVLVNNAGITAHGRFEETDPGVMRTTMEVNFFSMAEFTRLLVPVLRTTRGEKIILLVSTPSGLYGIPERFAYSASKAAGHMLMESLRLELKKEQIHTTVFCPGYTKTALRTSGLSSDGSVLHEEQSKQAKSPEYVANCLVQALEKRRRIAFTDTNGRAVYLLRTIAPALLEYLIARKSG